MKKIKFSELSEPVRSFLEQVNGDESIMVEDDDGTLRCGITPYVDATPEEKRRAQAALERLWERTGRAMQDVGVTEEDIDRDLQEGD
jgi:hypothetical protein